MGNRLFNILLLPRTVYKRVTDKKLTLYLGIILVGAIDLFSPIIDKLGILFTGKPEAAIYQNVALAVGFIILLGLMDVVFFSLPLFDIFKFFKKEQELIAGSGMVIKIIKVYIIAHLVTTPFLLFHDFAAMNKIYEGRPLLTFFLVCIELFRVIWFCAIISRGINTLYNFKPVFKLLVFIVVYLWSYLMAIALQYILSNWMLVWFK